MKNMIFKRSKLGFTLAELLLVIAILVILVGLGVSGFAALRQNIIIAKYDDLAREIYVAAQNQLTRLEANGLDQITLGALNKGESIPSNPSDSGYTPEKWENVKGFYRYAGKSNNQPMTVLLPLGAVADSVRTNGFYVIEYNVQTRTVYSVFYAEKSFSYSSVSAMDRFRSSRDVRKGPMVGYYGGSTVERDPQTHCPTPKLEIINNNELRLNILEVPTDVSISVKITDSEGNSAQVTPTTVSGDAQKKTVLLDSMEQNYHFHELFNNLKPGSDLTITVTYSNSKAISSSASVTANSLFATREGDTVTLAWARHLQNLEETVSNLNDPTITVARQTEHIQWEENANPFVSISNENLERFEGNNLEIRDLRGSNGLFVQTKAGMELSSIRVVNPVINAVGTDPVGALVGTATPDTIIHGCGVYANKRTDDNTIAYNTYKDCYVDGKEATTGGLVGQATDVTVTSSFAALPILKGGNGAALIGSASGCNITNSYANCDELKPGFNYFVSGAGESNTIRHCYAVGNVESDRKSEFCGSDTVTDSYYAVSHRDFGENWADNQDLAATEFRYKGETGGWETIDQERMQNATKDGGWAEGTTWTNMPAPLSHPYREYLNGRAFPYPAIAEMDHYGSWPDGDGVVNLKIDMILLNNGSAGYAIFAGRVVVKDLDGNKLFDSYDSKNADGSFNGKDTISLSPETTVRIEITAEDGYEYLYTTIDGTQHYPTPASTIIEYTVRKDTEADVTFRQEAFTLTGFWAVNSDVDGAYIDGSSYSIDLTNPLKTLNITNNAQTERVETGSKVTVRPKTPEGYSGCVVWHVPAGQNGNQAKRTYLTPGAEDTYTFEMPAGDTEVHVMYTDKEAFFRIEYYLMDPSGGYPDTPTQEADYKCGLGSQINQAMINALAESSGLPLTIDKERVRYLARAVIDSQQKTDANPVFESTLDENGTVISTLGPHLTAESETSEAQPYLVKIYIDRKLYTVTLTADTHVDGVRFGDTGDFQRTVSSEFRYGASVTAQANVAPGYQFTYWDPKNSRFMMSADPVYTFQVPQFDLHLWATAATDRQLVTINLLENDDSWLFSSPSRQADPITLTLVNSIDPNITYPMQVLTEDKVSYAMQAVVPAISEYGEGYYVRANYASGLQAQIYHTSTQNSTADEQLILYVRDKPVERTARFYTVTYHPNKQLYAGTVPKGGTYPKYYQLTVQGNSGLLSNLTDNEKIFSGWKDYYAEGTGSDAIYTGHEILTITHRVDMFAQWKESLHVMYDGNGADGGELPVDAKTYQDGETVTVKFGSLTRKGHQFLGWSTDPGATEPTYTQTGLNTFQIGSVDATLYAVWKQEEYTVHFFDTAGNPLTGANYNFTGMHYNDTIRPVPSLEVEGQQIIGWSLTKGGEIVCRPGESYTITGNTELYARVAPTHITVTYKSGDGNTTYKTEQFGIGIPGYLNCVPEVDGKSAPVTAWRDEQGILYFCDDSGRSEKVHAFMEDTTLYAITGKVYNYNKQLWFDTLYAAVRSNSTQNGDTLIVYRDTEEPYNIWFNKSLYVIASGNRTVKWKDGATVDSGDMHRLDDPNKETGEFVGCMSVGAVTIEFGRSDIPTLSMKGSTLTFDANRQSRVISLNSGATFHMYDDITLTNGYRTGNKTGNGRTYSNRTGYGGGVYAGSGSVFYMHGGTVSFCEAVSGGGVYLITGSRMYMGDMVLASAYSATATYYTKVHDESLNEDVYTNAIGVTQENFKQFYVAAGNPLICYNSSTHVSDETYGDGGGGLLMLDLNNGELTLFRGSITNNTTTGNGGGVMTDSANDNCFLRIYEVDISHNTAEGIGGGIYQWHGTVYIYNSAIRQNKAQKGGGIYLKNGGGVYNIEFYFGDISDNEAVEYGGGVYAKNGAKFYLRGGNVLRNKAQYGGGVYLEGGRSLLSLEKGTVSGNIASANGGGVFSAGKISISGGTLSDNRAEDSGGGAYCNTSSSVTMTDGTVCNNSARYLGGGFMVGGPFYLSGGSLYGNTDTDYAANHKDDEDNVTPGPNDIYLAGQTRVITIPKGGIMLSGEERVAVDRDYDGSVRFGGNAPFPLASYEDPTDFHENDALHFTYFGTRSSDASLASGKKDLTVVTHLDLTGNYATGLYLNEKADDEVKDSYVSFDLNYPNCNNPESVPYQVGTTLNINEVGPDTTRPGYYLAGWARTPHAVEEEYALFYDVVANKWRSAHKDGAWTEENDAPLYTVQDLSEQTLYAMWRPCVVVYDVGNTAKDNGVKIQPSSTGPRVTILNPSPMRYTANGLTHDFLHWADEEGNKYIPMQQVNLTENLRLHAVWQDRIADSFIITFYFNDGTSDQTGELRREVVVKAGERYKIDVEVHQANKILLGWATSKNATTPDYATDYEFTSVEADMDLYAVWTDAVTLTYNVNGGDGNGTVVSIAQGDTVKITEDVPTRTGYIFLGWATTPDAKEVQYVAGDDFGPLNLNTTLYAVWGHLITFDLDGGEGAEFGFVKVPHDGSYTLPEALPTKADYTFFRWSMEGSEGYYTPGETVTVTGDITFKAVWYCTLTLYANGGKINSESDRVSVKTLTGTVYNLAQYSATRDGYILKGWATTATATEPEYLPDDDFVFEKNTDLYAVWEEAVTLSYDMNGGTGSVAPVAVKMGSTVPITDFVPTKEGHIFLGWIFNQGEAMVPYQFGDSIKLTEDTTLYALWEEKKWTVSFDLDGGTGTGTDYEPREVRDGETFVLPDQPLKNGAVGFACWSAGGRDYQPGETVTVTSDMTFKAIYRYRLILMANGGKIHFNGEVDQYTNDVRTDQAFNLSQISATWKGYRLRGWATRADAWRAEYAPDDNITLTGNITLYAIWQWSFYSSSSETTPVEERTVPPTEVPTLPTQPDRKETEPSAE